MSEEQVNAALADVLADLDSPHSRRSYASDWNRYCEWLAGRHIDVLAATPKVIRDHCLWMRDEKHYKRSTVGKALSVIREVYRALVTSEVIAVNPARETKTPKADHALKTPVLTEAEMRHLIASMPMTTWRRTCITISGEKGVSLKARQLAVGHSSSATTERYDRARDARRDAPGNVFAEIVGAA